MADEGKVHASLRLKDLDNYQQKLSNCLDGKYESHFWAALHQTVLDFSIDTKLLFDLLDAFKQDLVKNRFRNFDEILAYCEKSATPVGRIILSIYEIRNSELEIFSDKICIALQLTNFYQDTRIDLSNNRIYYPIDEIEKHNVSIPDLMEGKFNSDTKKLISFQVERAESLFEDGKPLLKYLPYKLRIQINATIGGGIKILSKIKQIDFNVLKFRVKLSKFDALSILLKALR